jgi:asparagine synthetase B (glutamine-hydrolysing)
MSFHYVHPFHTFTVGFQDAPDIRHAQIVADYIKSEHHIRHVKIGDLLAVLPFGKERGLKAYWRNMLKSR